MNPDDDIHLIVTMKRCLFPCFYCKQTHHRPNRMPIDMRTTDRHLEDQIHARHCMSLLIASPNPQYYLKAGCGLACAVVSLQQDSSKIKERPTQKFSPIAT
jgi:hypothetical protein